MNHYDTLGVAHDASADEIRAAYRRAARDAHPDKEGGSTEAMQAVNAAYDVLSDPKKRAAYDEMGAMDPDSPEARAQSHLDSIFTEAIRNAMDPLEHARAVLNESQPKLKRQAVKLQNDVAAATLRLGKTRRKTKGRNRIEDLLSAHIAGLDAQLTMTKQAMQLAEAVLKLLDEYESLEPVKPKVQVYTPADIGAIYSQQANAFRGY